MGTPAESMLWDPQLRSERSHNCFTCFGCDSKFLSPIGQVQASCYANGAKVKASFGYRFIRLT